MVAVRESRVEAGAIGDVVERMREIDRTLPRLDGVALFNRMYLMVTEAVAAGVSGATFQSPEFLERLDIRFAALFFAAVDADAAGERVPAPWRPLFESRAKADVAPVQFALAGMNAHINHDLAVAVVETCREMGLVPEDDSSQHVDFCTTNGVLASIEDEVKVWFSSGLVAELDERLGKIDDAFAMWSITKARGVAWNNAQLLWSLDDNPRLRAAYLSSLVRMVKLAGRGILL